MYKVLIVDDETKVCKLIHNLIDWASLGLEVIGLANDGVTAFNYVKEKRPDIVITDIRMPGYDGINLIKKSRDVNPNINFIIISGYKHFDYAHNAIKYGVEDYLLKPVIKVELLDTLNKMCERFNKEKQKNNETEGLKRQLKDDQERLKIQLAKYIFYEHYELIDINKINNDYGLQLLPGYFQAFIVKPDIQYSEDSVNAYDILLKKFESIVRKGLLEFCSEFLVCQCDQGIFGIANFEEYDQEKSRKAYKMIMDSMEHINSMYNIFPSIAVTVGLGSVITEISELQKTVGESKQAIINRVIVGVGKIIDESCSDQNQNVDEYVILNATRQGLLNALEVFDSQAVFTILKEIKDKINMNKNISGKNLYNICKGIMDVFLMGIKDYISQQEEEKIKEEFIHRYNMARCIDDAFDLLQYLIDKNIRNVAEMKKQRDNKPIRDSKQYMQQNYYLPITLEEVSQQIGFNPAYFSYLFKKSTGINFLQYLAGIRTQEAKKLLAETNLSIIQIAEDVGYKNLKHFTKVFKKSTGLTPNEYRKLYY